METWLLVLTWSLENGWLKVLPELFKKACASFDRDFASKRNFEIREALARIARRSYGALLDSTILDSVLDLFGDERPYGAAASVVIADYLSTISGPWNESAESMLRAQSIIYEMNKGGLELIALARFLFLEELFGITFGRVYFWWKVYDASAYSRRTLANDLCEWLEKAKFSDSTCIPYLSAISLSVWMSSLACLFSERDDSRDLSQSEFLDYLQKVLIGIDREIKLANNRWEPARLVAELLLHEIAAFSIAAIALLNRRVRPKQGVDDRNYEAYVAIVSYASSILDLNTEEVKREVLTIPFDQELTQVNQIMEWIGLLWIRSGSTHHGAFFDVRRLVFTCLYSEGPRSMSHGERPADENRALYSCPQGARDIEILSSLALFFANHSSSGMVIDDLCTSIDGLMSASIDDRLRRVCAYHWIMTTQETSKKITDFLFERDSSGTSELTRIIDYIFTNELPHFYNALLILLINMKKYDPILSEASASITGRCGDDGIVKRLHVGTEVCRVVTEGIHSDDPQLASLFELLKDGENDDFYAILLENTYCSESTDHLVARMKSLLFRHKNGAINNSAFLWLCIFLANDHKTELDQDFSIEDAVAFLERNLELLSKNCHQMVAALDILRVFDEERRIKYEYPYFEWSRRLFMNKTNSSYLDLLANRRAFPVFRSICQQMREWGYLAFGYVKPLVERKGRKSEEIVADFKTRRFVLDQYPKPFISVEGIALVSSEFLALGQDFLDLAARGGDGSIDREVAYFNDEAQRAIPELIEHLGRSDKTPPQIKNLLFGFLGKAKEQEMIAETG
jgi:hypothetical protein